MQLFGGQDRDRRVLRLQQHEDAGDSQRVHGFGKHRVELRIYLSLRVRSSRHSGCNLVYDDAKFLGAADTLAPKSWRFGIGKRRDSIGKGHRVFRRYGGDLFGGKFLD